MYFESCIILSTLDPQYELWTWEFIKIMWYHALEIPLFEADNKNRFCEENRNRTEYFGYFGYGSFSVLPYYTVTHHANTTMQKWNKRNCKENRGKDKKASEIRKHLSPPCLKSPFRSRKWMLCTLACRLCSILSSSQI